MKRGRRVIGSKRIWRMTGMVLLIAGAWAGFAGAQPVELTIATHWGSGTHLGLLLDYIREYNEMQSDVVVVHNQSAGFSGTPNEQFLLQAAAGAAPDIVHFPDNGLRLYAGDLGLIVPPPPAVRSRLEEVFLPGALSLSTLDGVLYGPPTENQMHGLALNGVVFREAGVAPDPPQLWDELASLARRVRRIGPDDAVQVAGAEMISTRTILSLAWGNGAEIFDEGQRRATLESDAWVETVRFLADLVQSGSAILGNGQTFYEEKAGILLGAAPWMRNNYVAASGEESYAQLVTAEMPAGRSGRPVAEAWGYVLGVTKLSEHQTEAWQFIEWLTTATTERGTTRMGDVMAALGSIPATYPDFYNQPSRNEAFMLGFGEIVTKGYTRRLDVLPLRVPIRNSIGLGIEPALRGEASERAVLAEVQRLLQNALDEYWSN